MRLFVFLLRFSIFVLLGHAMLDIINGAWALALALTALAMAVAVAVAFIAEVE